MTDKHIKTQAAGRSSVSLPLWLLQSVFHVMLLNHLSARCLQQSTRVKHKLSPPSLPPPLCLTPVCLTLSASPSLPPPLCLTPLCLPLSASPSLPLFTVPSLTPFSSTSLQQFTSDTCKHRNNPVSTSVSIRLHIIAPYGHYRKTDCACPSSSSSSSSSPTSNSEYHISFYSVHVHF